MFIQSAHFIEELKRIRTPRATFYVIEKNLSSAGGNARSCSPLEVRLCYGRTMCKIEGCDGKAVAKGLCVKHYMRARRTGDPNHKGKPGRKRSPVLALYRGYLSDWSPSHAGPLYVGMSYPLLSESKKDALLKAATRPNGSINVSKLLDTARIAQAMAYPLPEDEKQALLVRARRDGSIDGKKLYHMASMTYIARRSKESRKKN